MESDRLPGKVWKKMNGQPMLLWQLARLSICDNVDNLIVATANSSENTQLYTDLVKHGYSTFIGMSPMDDVLSRYLACWHWMRQEIGLGSNEGQCIVRITGDCPFVDPKVVDDLVLFFEDNNLDYAALAEEWPDGLDAEIFTVDALVEAHNGAKEGYEREHVTPWMYMRENNGLRCADMPCPFDFSGHSWSVDTGFDFYWAEKIQRIAMKEAGFDFGYLDVWQVLLRNKTWLDSAIKPRNESFMKQVGIDGAWEDLRYEKGKTVDDLPDLSK
jgi:spore coat polysaccharide biosynthesis protein SpsF (cytidylyltransferase family)